MNYWDNIASNKGYYYNDFNNKARLLAAKLIKAGDSILDVGCGNGMMYALLKDSDVKYEGIDYSEKMIANCKERFPEGNFKVFDVRNLSEYPENSYDVVYMRHCLENIKDWKEAIRQMFRIARKRVVIDMRRPFVRFKSVLIEEHEDTVCWDIDGDEFNILCRNLTVNVSYLENIGDTAVFAVLGKKMDDVVFTLDDFHENNHRLDLLLDMKQRFPKMKVTLFTIPAMCSAEWLKDLKSKYDWMEFAVHGWFHNITNRPYDDGTYYPEECLNWTEEDAHKYLKMAEDMGVFIKGFKAPGWGMNTATFKALKEREYWVMDNRERTHERPKWVDNNYETGHLWEVNGHIHETPFNGLETINKKLNFTTNSNFYFVSDIIGTENEKKRLCHYLDQIQSQE